MADYISQFTGGEIDRRLAKVSELEAGKQDKLVSGETIKTIGGQSVLGEGNIPLTDQEAVKFTPQTLTDAQKAQALANIGAASEDEVAALADQKYEGPYESAAALPTASASTMGAIYLVGPDGNGEYDRYVTKVDGSTYTWGSLGKTSIDLSNYATKAEVGELEAEVGDLSELETTDKTDLVSAINEAAGIVGPERIDGEAQTIRERKTLTFTDGGYKQVKSPGYVIGDVTHGTTALVEFPANGGDVIDMCTINSISSSLYYAYFIFAVNDTTSAVLRADIGNYVTEIDSENHIYRLNCPEGTTKIFSACSINKKDQFWAEKVSTTKELEWLKVTEDNLDEEVAEKLNNPQVQSVGPNQIDGTAQDIAKEDITISFDDGYYHTVNNGTPPAIATNTNASFSLIVIPAQEGDIIELKFKSAVPSSIYNSFFIFAVSDTIGAAKGNELANYVTEVDSTNFIYRLVCPAGTTKIFSTCKTTDKSVIWAKKVIRTKELKWLLVKESNIDKDAVTSIVNKSESQTLATLESNGKKYHLWDSIKKKFDFTGKKLTGFGDSITSGVSSPGLVTITDSYLKLFCDYAGVTNYTKKAISGSCLADADGDGGYSIYESVTGFSEATDAIVIAGGTNDWNTGKPLGTFGSSDVTTVYGALKGICEYLQTNYPDAYVVFITPIPYTKPVSAYPNHIAPLDEYRSAIYDVATYYGYSVVNGLDLGMPREQGGWNNTMCDDADGCHPTARGHALYARSLAGKLL